MCVVWICDCCHHRHHSLRDSRQSAIDFVSVQDSVSSQRPPSVVLLKRMPHKGSCVATLLLVRSASSFLSKQTISSSRTALMSTEKSLVVDPFCFRQFQEHEASKTYGGTVFDLTVAEFEAIVNEKFDSSNLVDGYAPFCKHIFLKNTFSDNTFSRVI